MQTKTRTRFTLVAALLAGTALGGVGVATGYAQNAGTTAGVATQTTPTTIQPSGTTHPIPDFADLVADVQGFEEIMRVRIAVVVSQCMQEVDREVLEHWLNLNGEKFERFVREVCGWTIEDGGKVVKVPLNKENEARGTIVRENVKFEQFGRMIKRAYEQPA